MKNVFITIIFVILLLFSFWGIYVLVQQIGSPKTQPKETVNTSIASELNNSNPTQSQDGIDVDIVAIKEESQNTVVELAMNNHRYDLSAFDVRQNSQWGNASPIDYVISGNQTGGHHIQAQLTFAGKPNGNLVIGLTKDLRFVFNTPPYAPYTKK